MQASSPPEEHNSDIRRRLLRSFPEVDSAVDGKAVIDALISGAICEVLLKKGAAALLTVSDIILSIKAATNLEYEQTEVVASLERLETAGHLEFRGPAHKAFVFSSERFAHLRSQREYKAGRDTQVAEAWKSRIRIRHGLPTDTADRLFAGLDAFLTDLVHARAEEAAAFLYMTDDFGQVRFYNTLDTKLPDLTSYVPTELLAIAEKEFPTFFDVTDPGCVDLLADRVHAAFYFHLLTIDPTASELVKDRFREKTLYLDSNFLYRLLGLHGVTLSYAPATIVELSRQLASRIVVARETLNEFVRSLRSEIRRLNQTPVTRDTYRRIAAERPTGDVEFMQAFYREWHSGRVGSVDEFERKYTNVEAMLKDWGVDVEEEAFLTEDETREPDYKDRFSLLNNWHRMEKATESIDHDVFLWRHLRRLRGATDTTPSAIRYWLLTYDRRLTVFSVYHATATELPFALLADDWLQIIRPFLPRTANHERSFVAMLAHPLLYQQSRKAIPFEHVASALNRLERYTELPFPVVAAMVADGEFVRKLNSTTKEAEARRLIELQAEKAAELVASENAQLHEQLRTAVGRLQDLETTLDELHSTNTALARDAETFKSRSDAAVQDALATSAAYEERIAGIERRTAAILAEREQSAASAIAAVRQNIHSLKLWGVYAFATVAVVMLGLALVFGPLASRSALQRVVALGWLALVDIAALLIPLKKHRGLVISAVMALLGLLGLSYQLWIL